MDMFSLSREAAQYSTIDRKQSVTANESFRRQSGGERRSSSERNGGFSGFAQNGSLSVKTIQHLPDKTMLHVFGYLRQKELCRLALVCKKWKLLAYDGHLWAYVSCRPDHGGLYISSVDVLLSLVTTRFGSALRFIELPAELIMPSVLHELANRCPNVKYLTLDFSNAMQLHDFNDMNSFPCNLRSLTICLSEVIFMEGFMRKVYQSLSSIEVLHLIGTFELGDEEAEEIYEVINIGKIKAHTPNLRIVNLYGINFVDDTHVELLSSNCIHLECLAINFCLRVKGSTLRLLVHRCKKLKTLLMQHCSLEDSHMRAVEWEMSKIHELDLTSTELSSECLMDILCRAPGFTFLGLGFCEFFNDKILEQMVLKGKLDHIRAIDISHTASLTEAAIFDFINRRGRLLEGLMVAGKPKLAEQFFMNIIPLVKKIRILGIGTANGWFLRMSTRVHIDQIIICLSQNCPKLERLEVQWDPDTIRYSENSSKFMDQLRLKCPLIRSITLSDGEYYEMVKSNFERADRTTVVRPTTNFTTSLVGLLSTFKDLLFN